MHASAPPSLTIAILCYNEIQTLEKTVDACRSVMHALLAEYELLIVDDGSKDGSSEVARRLAQEHADVHHIRHNTNQGIAHSMRTAYAAAKKQWFVVVPADFEFNPKDLPEGVRLLRDHVVVCYYLTHLPPLHRRLVSGVQRGMNRLLFGVRIRHVNWVKIVPVREIHAMKLVSKTMMVETEIMVRLLRSGYKIQEIPSHNVVRTDRAGGTALTGYVWAVLTAFWEALVLWVRLQR